MQHESHRFCSFLWVLWPLMKRSPCHHHTSNMCITTSWLNGIFRAQCCHLVLMVGAVYSSVQWAQNVNTLQCSVICLNQSYTALGQSILIKQIITMIQHEFTVLENFFRIPRASEIVGILWDIRIWFFPDYSFKVQLIYSS